MSVASDKADSDVLSRGVDFRTDLGLNSPDLDEPAQPDAATQTPLESEVKLVELSTHSTLGLISDVSGVDRLGSEWAIEQALLLSKSGDFGPDRIHPFDPKRKQEFCRPPPYIDDIEIPCFSPINKTWVGEHRGGIHFNIADAPARTGFADKATRDPFHLDDPARHTIRDLGLPHFHPG